MKMRRPWLCVTLLVLTTLALCAPDSPWQKTGEKAGQEITGPDGGKYVWVPPGEFLMGDTTGYDGDQRPVHKVRITRGFWMGKHEVTNARYRAFCRATGHAIPPNSIQSANDPVVYVSWDDAVAYCKHYGMNLPTEAQWEYAARGPENRRYPWGEDWDNARCCSYGNRGGGGWSHPVGSFPAGASWCGALDLAGNVYEWCQDFYGERYYRKSPGDDPTGPESGDRRVLRGGAWISDPYHCRAPVRSSDPPDKTISYVGFRCAISPALSAADVP